MATTAPVYEDRQMSIGRVFQRAFAAVQANPFVILSLALVVGALPGLFMSYFFARLGMVSSREALQVGAISPGRFFAATLISWLVLTLISALVQGALTRAVVTANEGRQATFGESLSTGLSVILPLIGLSILFAIGITIGFVLLIVPGVILLLMWAVAVPSLVIENPGVFGAFGRSSELTKGAKWKIFGLFLVLGVSYWLLSIVLGLVGLSIYSASNSAAGLTAGNLVGTVVLGTIFHVFWGTIQPSLYVELRQWKEGTSADNLAQVFA